MWKTILTRFLVLIVVLASPACAPGVATPNVDDISTIIAQTLTALPATLVPEIPVTPNESPTPTLTETTAAPTATASLPSTTMTMTPISLSSFTPATSSSVAQIQVSVATNCRTGPGTAYPRVGGLDVGQVAEVVGRNDAGTYWIIRNPSRAGETCWLWGQYATLTGNTGALPVITPPPSPTPAPGFDVADEGLESCAGTGWWMNIGLENAGGLTFRSLALTVRDLKTDVSATQYADGFTSREGCETPETSDTLPPASSRIVSSPVFSYDLKGHRLRATITLCSELGQNGTCVTQTVNFEP